MKFFRLESPGYSSDYAHTWINGDARVRNRVRGAECSVCGTKGRPAGGEKILPIEWTVPSRPEGDIFWASLDGPIVSARLAEALRSSGATGFELLPVEVVRCGSGSPDQAPPMPETGEPEDLGALANSVPESGQSFYLLSIVSDGNLAPGMQAGTPCAGCGRVEIVRRGKWRDWNDSIWPGQDMFRFPTTRWIVVTERIAGLLDELGIGNLELTPLSPDRPVAEEQFPGLDERMERARETGKRRAGLVGRIVNPEDLGDEGDLRRMAEDLAARRQTVTVRRNGSGQVPRPNLELREGEDLAAYVVLRSLWPAGSSRWLEAVQRLVGLARHDAKRERGFNRLRELVDEAIRRFDAVNPDLAAANILIFVDHDSGLDTTDLHNVLTAEDGASYHQAQSGFDGQTKGRKRRLALCLWADSVGKKTTHFLLGLHGRSGYLDQFLHLGERQSRRRSN